MNGGVVVVGVREVSVARRLERNTAHAWRERFMYIRACALAAQAFLQVGGCSHCCC